MIDSIKSFARDNLAGVALMTVAIVAGVALLSLGGCEWGNIITRPTPGAVQAVTGAPPRATLNELELILTEYREIVNAEHRKNIAVAQLLADSIADGWQVAGFLQAATNVGIATAANGGWSGLPVGGGLLGLLAFGSGLLMKGPGTDKEKQKSFNKGQETAMAMLRAVNPNLVVPPDMTPPAAPA